MTTIKARITFIEELLGTRTPNEDVYRKYIASKAPNAATVEDEVANLGVDEVVDSGMTVFLRDKDNSPFIYDYQIKGFFKDACSVLMRIGGKDETGKKKKAPNESGKISSYKKIIDGLIFVFPRQILIRFDGDIGTCQRPLRANTPMGDRSALAISEAMPCGSTIDIEIQCLSDDLVAAVREWLDYGVFRGLGQWRNSGKGRFTWAEID